MPSKLSKKPAGTRKAATSPAPSEAPSPQTDAKARIAVYDERVDVVIAQRAAAQRHVRELMSSSTADTFDTLDAIERAQGEVKTLDARLENLQALRDAAQEQAARDVKRAAAAATLQTRLDIGEALRKSVTVTCVQFDKACDELERIVTELASEGTAIERMCHDVIAQQYGIENIAAMHDRLVLVVPRANARGVDVAIAITNRIQRLADILESQSLKDLVRIRDYLPAYPAKVAEARLRDTRTLFEMFDLSFEEKKP